MNKLNAVLLIALLASCLWQVKTAYESRQLFAALDKAREERQQLEAEFKRLDAEAQAQGTHLRVERVARERLQMRPATPAVIKYISDASTAVTPSTPSVVSPSPSPSPSQSPSPAPSSKASGVTTSAVHMP